MRGSDDTGTILNPLNIYWSACSLPMSYRIPRLLRQAAILAELLIQRLSVTTVVEVVLYFVVVVVTVEVAMRGNTESMHSIITRLDKTINLNIVI